MIATAPRTVSALALAIVIVAGACSRGDRDATPSADDSKPGPDGAPVFRDITTSTGIVFSHHTGATGPKYMPEAMGAGVAVIDYDGDGRQDLYFVDSGPIPRQGAPPSGGGNRLFRNLGGLRFEDVTARARVEGRGYGMGAVTGDYDADGDEDLYVTCLGSNILYRNDGNATFTDVTAAAGVDDTRWSTGAAFLDFDLDGKLDLFVQNYVDWTVEKHRPCFVGGKLVYCTPDQFEATASSLFRNRGDGTFEDVSVASGIAAVKGKGLGVCVEDLDGDGRPDIYCANDTIANLLFHNLGGGRFEELGLASGTGYSEDGKEQAGMGVDAADYDGDGRPDLVLTTFLGETNALYRNEGNLFFTEMSRPSGTGATSLARLGFGVRWIDYDADGLPDLVVANGHVWDNGPDLDPPVATAQPPTLYRNLGGGRFTDATEGSGKRFRDPIVGRGLATADLDDDGDLDLIVTTSGGAPRIFENVGGNANAWITVRVRGSRRDATAIGARVTVTAGGRQQQLTVRSGGSYLSQSDLRLSFGLGRASTVDSVVVSWPGGATDRAESLPTRRLFLGNGGTGASVRPTSSVRQEESGTAPVWLKR